MVTSLRLGSHEDKDKFLTSYNKKLQIASHMWKFQMKLLVD